jgi:hypothetical protein
MARFHKLLRFACALALFPSLAVSRAKQQPPPPPPPESPSPTSSSKSKPHPSHAHDFLVRGTVFNEKALSMPGAQLRIRRSGDKKFHWQSQTNSRGEFAMRVPQGAEYEIVVHVKGYNDQARPIDAKVGAEGSLVFRMEPLGGKS